MTQVEPQDSLQQLLDEFDKSPIVNAYANTLNAKPPPSIIYHYTDGAGLRGILETGKIWCTDIFNLNDTSEIRHGVAYACKLLRGISSADGVASQLNVFTRTVSKHLSEDIEQSANYFVCCFSGNGDDLGQWRAYADDGRGYAIGFDTVLLERAFVDAAPGNHSTFPLSYDAPALQTMLAQLVEQATRIVSTAAGQMTGQQLTHLSVRLSATVIHCSTFFKHKGYSNEEEYRFLMVRRGDLPVDNLKLRSSPYSLIRYCEFDWKSTIAHALKKVVVGPAADPKLGFKFVDDCKRMFLSDTHDIDIEPSEIPYRSTAR
jgi:hypothetical protein